MGHESLDFGLANGAVLLGELTEHGIQRADEAGNPFLEHGVIEKQYSTGNGHLTNDLPHGGDAGI